MKPFLLLSAVCCLLSGRGSKEVFPPPAAARHLPAAAKKRNLQSSSAETRGLLGQCPAQRRGQTTHNWPRPPRCGDRDTAYCLLNGR